MQHADSPIIKVLDDDGLLTSVPARKYDDHLVAASARVPQDSEGARAFHVILVVSGGTHKSELRATASRRPAPPGTRRADADWEPLRPDLRRARSRKDTRLIDLKSTR